MRVKALLALAAAMTVAVAARGRADEKGDALLNAAFSRLYAAKTFSAKVEQSVKTPLGENTFKGTVLAMKPNFFRFELSNSGPVPALGEARPRSFVGAPTFVSDGKNYFMYTAGGSNFQKLPIESDAKQMMGPWEGEVDAFFGGPAAGEKSESTVTGSEMVNGVDSHLLTVKMKSPDRTVTYAIGKDDRKIYRAVLRMKPQENIEIVQTNILTDIKLDETRSPEEFAFKPPAGVKELVRQDPSAKLVPVGKKAPDFSLPTPGGKKISLQDGLSRKKALLINFWFYN